MLRSAADGGFAASLLGFPVPEASLRLPVPRGREVGVRTFARRVSARVGSRGDLLDSGITEVVMTQVSFSAEGASTHVQSSVAMKSFCSLCFLNV